MATFDALVPTGTPTSSVWPFLAVPGDMSIISPDEVALLSGVGSSLTITVTCSSIPESSSSLLDPTKWTLARVAPLVGVTPTISSIQVDGSDLVFTTTEQTIGQNYRLTVNGASGIRAGQYVDFVGVGVRPNVIGVTIVGGKLRVAFSEAMLQNADLLNPAKYSVVPTTGGPTVRVTGVTSPGGNPSYVDLTFIGGRGGKTYNVRALVDA